MVDKRDQILPCNAFPAVEIEIKRVAKPLSTASSVFPSSDVTSLAPHLVAFYNFCSRPWVLLERLHATFKGAPVELLPLTPCTYEQDLSALKTEAGVTLASIGKLMNRMDKIDYRSPQLTCLYNPQWDWCRGVALMLTERNYARLGDPNASKVFQRPESFTFLVEPDAPSFDVPMAEPLFCSLALYHVRDKVKISETFHYSFFDGAIEEVTGSVKGELLSQRSCLFSVSVPSQYIHLVLVVMRILQGDEEKCAEPFFDAPSSALSKVLNKLGSTKDLPPDFYSRMGVFQQTFCFGSIPVFDAAGKFILNDKSKFDPLWFHGPGAEFPFFECLLGTYTKRKLVHGSCLVSARRVTGKECIPKRVDIALSPYVNEAGELEPLQVGEPGYIRDMVDFVPSAKPTPYMSYFGSLFLSPLSLTLPTRKSLCVRIELRSTDDDSVLVPLKSVFNSHGAGRRILSGTARSAVAYATKHPTWMWEEFHLHLPPKASNKHHVMFFFSEVDIDAVRKKRSDNAVVETLLGVSILPLLQKGGGIVGGTVRLPVVSCEQPLPRGYLSLYEGGTLPLVDGGKELFEVRALGFSATIPGDSCMAALYQFYDDARVEANQLQGDLVTSMVALRDVELTLAVSHFPLLVNALLRAICCTQTSHRVALQAFQTLLLLCARVHETEKQPLHKRSGLVYQFIEFGYEPLHDWSSSVFLVPHYGVAVQFMTLVVLISKSSHDSQAVKLPTLFTTSWMLFDLMFKSAAFASESKASSVAERLKRHPADFARILKKLFSGLRGLLRMACEKQQWVAEASDLSRNMALFLSDMLAIYDRGILCDLFVSHLQETRETITNLMGAVGGWSACSALSTMLLDFVKIFSDNEHFVPLNLPKPFHITSATQLCEQVEAKHPVVASVIGLVLDELLNNANPPPFGGSKAGGSKGPHKALNRSMALSLLANMVTKIDRDPRFAAAEDRHAIAVMFFPLVLRLLRIWKGLAKWLQATSDAAFVHEKQELLIAVVWVLRNLSRPWLQQWWRGVQADLFEKGTFFPLLEELAMTFKYRPNLPDLSTPFCTASNNVESLVDWQQPGGMEKIQKLRRRLGVHGVTSLQAGAATVESPEQLNRRLGFLAHDVGVLLLGLANDVLDDFAAAVRVGSRPLASNPARQVAGFLLCLVNVQMCAELARPLFQLQARWLLQQGAALFGPLKAETARLVEALLWMCGCRCDELRSEAASLLYNILTLCQNLQGSFEAVKSAAIVACSRLAEHHPDFGSHGFLHSALRGIADCAMQDYMTPTASASATPTATTTASSQGGARTLHRQESSSSNLAGDSPGRSPSSRSPRSGFTLPSSGLDLEDESPDTGSYRKLLFARHIQDFTSWLEKIVNDTLEIARSSAASSKDLEILADSYWRIAESYRQTPELRLEWLEKLAQFHAKNGDFPEAAMTMLHCVALISDYLNSRTEIKVDSAVFKRICPSVAEFYDEEAPEGGPNFTLRHWKFAMKATLKFLEEAEYFEMANELYRLLLPVYHREGIYRELGNSHTHLETMFMRLAQNDTGRLLGRYFRVAFFGPLFGQLNGKEFVYREKLLTHLFSLKERLCEHFDAVFGSGKVEVLDHGGFVDVVALDPLKGYLQITSVRPYFGGDDDEDVPRITFFQRSSMLQQFSFETPMTVAGKVGQVGTADQYMRRTILTTQFAFPYISKRVLVRSRKEAVITPIEVAIESMQGRVEKLMAEVSRKPPDSKMLQQVLQGSVLTTVNRGTIEYMETFLSQPGKFEKRFVKTLQGKFRLFFDAAKQALSVNQSIIEASQQDFQDEMQNGYAELLKLAAPLVFDSDDVDMEGSDSALLSARGSSISESPRVSRTLLEVGDARTQKKGTPSRASSSTLAAPNRNKGGGRSRAPSIGGEASSSSPRTQSISPRTGDE